MINERQRQLAILKVIGFITALLFVLVCAGYAHCQTETFKWNDTRENYTRKINGFLSEWFAHCSPRKLKRALSIVPNVIDASEREQVNPCLIASIISHESTWDSTARGTRDEVGLMQVKGSSAVTIDDQLRDGISKLKYSFERCGTTLGAVSFYGTGHTCKPYKRAQSRINMMIKIEGL